MYAGYALPVTVTLTCALIKPSDTVMTAVPSLRADMRSLPNTICAVATDELEDATARLVNAQFAGTVAMIRSAVWFLFMLMESIPGIILTRDALVSALLPTEM